MMDSYAEFPRQSAYSKENSEFRLCLLDEDKERVDMRNRINDLESQLEYEIEQHKAELTERDSKICKLEKIIEDLETNGNDGDKDEAIFQMSEKLLVVSNKYDELLKDYRLKEEELNHLKNKKKYRNDKTNNFIMTLKKEIEEQKKDYEQLNEKYMQQMKEISELRRAYNVLKQENAKEQAILLESMREEKAKKEDEAIALKILNLQNGMTNNPILQNKDIDELGKLKMELKYKEMIIQKLIKNKLTATEAPVPSVAQEKNYVEQIHANEKKIEELYNKYINSQSDSDKKKKQIDKLNNEIKYLKEENAVLLESYNDLKMLKSATPKNQRRISEFGDLLDNVLKENSILHTELSMQKKKNRKDVYYYNKEIELLENNKMKIIEKFDHKKILNAPHLYEPLYVTLNTKDDASTEDAETEHCQHMVGYNGSDSEEEVVKKNTKNPHVMDNLVHAYITDYMENVLNKK